MLKKGFPDSLIIIIALLIVSVLLLNCLNSYTEPIIEANSASSQFQTLYAVMPNAQGFDAIYGDGEHTLDNVPETVTGVYSESSGLGYVLTLSTNQGYTGENITMTMAVNSEGKLTALNINNYPETKEVGDEFLNQFMEKDSALAGVELVAGVTYSSSAIKNAISDGFKVLTDNELVGAGVKSDEQVIMELLPVEYPGIANNGIAQYEDVEGTGNIAKAFKAANGSGFGFLLEDGEDSYLGIWTVAGGTKLLDTEGHAVDNAALLEEIKSFGEANADDYSEKETAKLRRMTSDEAEITAMPMELYSSITGAYSITEGETQLYGFVARSYGYSNLPMAIYYVLDENGAIVSMTADELIFYKDYFSDYTLDEPEYKASFQGMSGDSYTGDNALIAGATMSTNGVDTATRDVFAAFEEIG